MITNIFQRKAYIAVSAALPFAIDPASGHSGATSGELLRQWGSLPGGDPTQVSPEDRVLAERELATLV